MGTYLGRDRDEVRGRTLPAGPSVALRGPPADKDGLRVHLPLGALSLVAAPLLKQGVGVAAQGRRRRSPGRSPGLVVAGFQEHPALVQI